jgi:hypothetical protein
MLVQHALTASGPMFFVGLRFAAAASIVALFSIRSLSGMTLFELKAGAFIGIAIMLGYGLQTIGLQTIPAASRPLLPRSTCLLFRCCNGWCWGAARVDAKSGHHAGFYGPDAALRPRPEHH